MQTVSKRIKSSLFTKIYFQLFLKVFTYGEADGSSCKFYSRFGCNSYIKLFVDDDELFRSSTMKDKFVYDADITFTTGRISKDSTIKIEIWDESSAFWELDRLILKTDGNVESFLKQPLREGVMVGDKRNAIETVSFWQDEYKEDIYYRRSKK